MLDELYNNIGGKIKSWAKGIFILEAIFAIIAGIVLIFDYAVFIGFLTLIVGPLAAFVSSWLLYAFGELVEKMVANEHHTKAILYLLRENARNQEQRDAAPTKYAGRPDKPSANPVLHTERKVCPKCQTAQNTDRTICWACGQPFDS